MKLKIPIFFFVMHAMDYEKGLSGMEVTRRVNITYSHTLKLMKDICVKKGYVVIQHKGRCAYHFLTEKGKQIKQKIGELFILLDITNLNSFEYKAKTNNGIKNDSPAVIDKEEEIVLEGEDEDDDY